MKERMAKKNNSILRIRGMYDSMNTAEKKIADYILKFPQNVVDMTIEVLATATGTSYATIARFCNKLEYSGIKELRSGLVYNLTHAQDVDEMIESLDITINASVEEICEKIYGLSYKVLDESLAFMEIDIVNEVVELLLKAKRVVFIGSGTSGICAMYASTKCLSIGMLTQYYSDQTFYRMAASLLEKDDVLFAISSSGRTSGIVETAKLAKSNGVPVVSLSDFAVSPLSKVSDYILYTTPRNGSTFMNIDMPLLMGQITFIDFIYSCLCVKNPKVATSAYSLTRASVDSEKIK